MLPRLGRSSWIALATAAMGLALAVPGSAAAPRAANVESLDFVTPSIGYAVLASGYTGTAVRLYRTADGGGHWAMVAGHLPEGHYPYESASVAFATATSGIALMSLGAGACQAEWDVFRTANGGRTWQAAGRIVGSDGPVALAAGAQGVPWMLNGSCAGPYATLFRGFGRTWPELHSFALPAAQAKAYFSPSAVSLQRFDATRAFLAVAYYPAAPKARAALIVGYRTADGGAAWQPVGIGGPGRLGAVSALAFYSPSEGLAVVRSDAGVASLELTRDGGRHWLPLRAVSMPPSAYPTSIAWLSAKVAYVLVGQVIWRTADGGRTWHIITSRWPG